MNSLHSTGRALHWTDWLFLLRSAAELIEFGKPATLCCTTVGTQGIEAISTAEADRRAPSEAEPVEGDLYGALLHMVTPWA